MSYDKRNCALCGIKFWPMSSTQQCCCKDHSREYNRQEQAEKLKAERLEDNAIRKPQSKPQRKTDWKAIDMLCLETGLSYGQLVLRGML